MNIETGFAEINGARMYYETAGEGDGLVLLHAGIADRRMWDGQFEALAGQYRVVRYDLRGFGQTTAPPMPYTHHDDLRALLDTIGVERAAVIGCSNGGRVAMNFTLANPQRVTRLAMVCSAPGGFEPAGFVPAALDEAAYEAFQAGDLEKAARLGAQLWFAGPERSPELVDQAKLERVYEMNLIALRKQVAGVGDEQSMSPPAAQRLSEIHIPTLIIVGEYDEPFPGLAAPFMEKQIADVRKITLPTAHLPSMEIPDEFNRIVLEFLE